MLVLRKVVCNQKYAAQSVPPQWREESSQWRIPHAEALSERRPASWSVRHTNPGFAKYFSVGVGVIPLSFTLWKNLLHIREIVRY